MVRGGLTNHKEIKVLICYILFQLQRPISHATLLDAISDEGLANYFECADAISELLEQGHVQSGDDGYTLTKTGTEIATLLQNDVPLTAREKASTRAQELLRRQINAKQYVVNIIKSGDGYIVRGTISGLGSDVFAVELYAPSSLQAQKIKTNFIDRGEDIMRGTIEALTKEPM